MISVIIPAYNAEKDLADCLTALKSQTRPPDEIIVVDDGSTDQTFQIASQNQVTVIHQANQGPAAARNAGVAAASGDIILFTDADCQPEPHWVERMAAQFNNPVVNAVKGSYKTKQSSPVSRLIQCEFEERYQLLSKSEWIDFVDTHAAAFQRKVFVEIGGFDPGFPKANNEDVDLSYRLASSGKKIVFAPDAFVFHRHCDTFLKYFQLKVSRGYWRMIVYRHHPGKAVKDSYTPQILKVQILLAYLGLGCLAVGIFIPWFILFFGVAAVLFFLSTLSFRRLVEKFEPGLVNWTVWFLLVRALAFSIGIAAGLVGMFTFRFKLQSKN